MKWEQFSLAVAITPISIVLLLHYAPYFRPVVITGFFLCLAHKLSVNFVSMEWYRGSSRGIEVSLSDLLIVGLALHLFFAPQQLPRRRRMSLESKAFGVYLLMALISTAFAYVPVYGAFGLARMCRGALVFFVFSRLIEREKDVRHLLNIYALMILYQLPVVLSQKYLQGIYRATGTLPHMNTLALMMNFMALPVFASLMLDNQKPRIWYAAAFLSGAFCVLATLSRGAFVTFAAGMIWVTLSIRRHHLNRSRVILIFVLILLGSGGLVKAADTIIERFIMAPLAAAEVRTDLNVCARMMASDHVLGVGVNNYSHMIGKTWYGEFGPLAGRNRDDGVAHHIYLLTAAEMGYGGLAAFLVFIGAVQLRSLRIVFSSRSVLLRTFACGAFAGLLSLHLQGLLEWILRQAGPWMLFCALAGVLRAMQHIVDQESSP